jgi:hypothetical protein
MPSGWEQNAVYLQSGNPETEATPTLLEPGLLGARFTIQNPARSSPGVPARAKRYQLVRTDSTMTTAPYPGALAYWADKTQYLVTTVNTNLNLLAGVFRFNVPPGYFGCVQCTGPSYVKLVDGDMAAAAPGDNVVGSATPGKGTRVASGTPLNNVSLGRISTPLTKLASDAQVQVDLDVPETP